MDILDVLEWESMSDPSEVLEVINLIALEEIGNDTFLYSNH
jgi:hypothetical protein